MPKNKLLIIAEIGSSPAPDWRLAQWAEAAAAVGAAISVMGTQMKLWLSKL